MDVKQKIKDIIVDVMCIDADTIKMDDGIITVIGCDSLEVQEIRYEIERELDIDFTDEEFNKVITVADMIHLTEEKLEAKKNG